MRRTVTAIEWELADEEHGDGQLLGNFPQASSHVGLINAAWAIAEAERRQNGETLGSDR